MTPQRKQIYIDNLIECVSFLGLLAVMYATT